MIVQEQSPGRVMEVRSKLYELLSHCIPPTVILKVSAFSAWVSSTRLASDTSLFQTIAERVVDRVDESLKADIMHWAAVYVSVDSLKENPPHAILALMSRSCECGWGTRRFSTSKHGL